MCTTTTTTTTHPLATFEQARVYFAVKLQETTSSSRDRFVSALSIVDEIGEQIFFHRPWLPPADLTYRIDSRSDDLAPYSGVYELLCDLAYHGGQGIWWSEVVNGLGKSDEDGRDAELVVGEVLDDVGIESEDT